MLDILAALALAALAVSGPRRAVSERPIASYFTDGDYPASALREGAAGRVQVRVDVDTTGRPTACAVVESSGNAELDARTCALTIERVRFKVATNAAGRATRDTITFRVVWRIRDVDYSRFVRRERILTYSPAATVSACRQFFNGEEVSADRTLCQQVFGSGGQDLLGTGFDFTLIETLIPAGQTPLGEVDPARGRLAARTEVEIEVGPSGSVDACRTVKVEPAGLEQAVAPEICERLLENRFEESDEPRRVARVALAYYFRQRSIQ